MVEEQYDGTMMDDDVMKGYSCADEHDLGGSDNVYMNVKRIYLCKRTLRESRLVNYIMISATSDACRCPLSSQVLTSSQYLDLL
jgi:hypothetical protein